MQSEEDFKANWNRDKQEPTSRLSAVRLKMNRWTDAEDGWINVEDWDAVSQAVKIPDGAAVTLGVDIGAVRDLTAVSVVALIDGKYVAESWGFVPAGALQTRDAVNTAIYQACQADGSLTVTPGQATDERLLCAFLDRLCAKYKVMSVAIDKWQSIVISNHLMAKGIETFNFYQSHAMYNGPCLELEKLVSQKRIVIGNNTLLRWQVAHTFLSRDSKGYVKPMTSRYENKKDNLCSLLMGLSQTLVQSQAASRRISVYESRPLTLI